MVKKTRLKRNRNRKRNMKRTQSRKTLRRVSQLYGAGSSDSGSSDSGSSEPPSAFWYPLTTKEKIEHKAKQDAERSDKWANRISSAKNAKRVNEDRRRNAPPTTDPKTKIGQKKAPTIMPLPPGLKKQGAQVAPVKKKNRESSGSSSGGSKRKRIKSRNNKNTKTKPRKTNRKQRKTKRK